MPTFKHADAEIHYEVHGQGFPVLLFAPGGLRSQLDYWKASPADPAKPAPWMNPMLALADRFTVIGMDQRNAGKSRAGLTAADGWHSYAEDHFALMDHLGFGRFAVMGGCIGGSFCFEAIEQAPARITAAVLQNPIGLWENRDTWDDAVRGFGKTMRERDSSISQETIDAFGRNMFGSDFVFSVTRDFVKGCRTSLLLQPGIDKPHPAHTSAEIAALAPNIEVQKDWRGPQFLQDSIKRVRAFLETHTPH
jgi:pimeloyl-ACP methyl ester carboxylesterase